MRRERDAIMLCLLLLPLQLSTQPTRGARSAQSRLASPSPEIQPSSFKTGTQLTAFPQISAHASGACRHPNTLVSIPIWDFYFDISEWHILSACTWTPALMLHLTNPCAKQKVLSLTKPKGKIYKTKSLRHYTTKWVNNYNNDTLWDANWLSNLGPKTRLVLTKQKRTRHQGDSVVPEGHWMKIKESKECYGTWRWCWYQL